MKKYLTIMAMCWAAGSFAQTVIPDTRVSQAPAGDPAARMPLMTGGYAPTSPQSAMDAANFAVNARAAVQKGDQFKLVSVVNAERQVVAGANYHMCLALTVNGKPQHASATVYQDLKNQYQLTDWTPGKCK